ncbi:glucosamine-6-phosphate deaminase [Achromobacter sp. F4_2707]|uniref:glucosamine-6-phosphate deaminase n=1 Tax=Achromobacter sp. F4_2707 TaxID=3114286 RepID=UPI0039C61A0F
MLQIFPDASSIAEHVSSILITKIKSKPDVVLGLATGGTMEPIYARFVERVRQQKVDVSRLTSFNLDEYVGLGPDHPKSYSAYMRQHLFQHLEFDPTRLHVPDGLAPDLEQHSREYSAKLEQTGGVELQLLGVGSNGHIGFNEPGTPFDSRCHVVQLSERTRIDNSRFFEGDAIVPASAITMGMVEIMQAREVLLVATGENKAEIVAEWYRREVTEAVPFTILKKHQRARIILDEAAASRLPADVRKALMAASA